MMAAMRLEELRRHLELYQEWGCSVIPLLPREKRPALPWREYQHRRPTPQELAAWFGDGRHNVGIVCGEISGNLVVLDFDDLGAYEWFISVAPALPERAPVVETGRGFQIYLRSDVPVPTFRVPELKLDVRGEGAYVVAPPSIHPEGKTYRFTNDVRVIPRVRDLERRLRDKFEALGVGRPPQAPVEPPPEDWIARALAGVPEEQRDVTCPRLAGYFRAKGLPEDVALAILLRWARDCQPPFPEEEVRKCVRSVWRYPRGERLDLPVVSLGELLSRSSAEKPWLVERILPEGGALTLVGNPGVGKTWLALHLACAVASGKPFLGRFSVAKAGAVLVIDEENGERRLQERLRQLVGEEGLGLPVYVSSMAGLNLSRQGWREALEVKVAELAPRLVIFDSLVRIHRGDENKARDVAELFTVLSELRKRYGTAVAFTHHLRKRKSRQDLGQLIRGSSDILAYVDSALAVMDGKEGLVLQHVKSRDGEPIDPLGLRIEDAEGDRVRLVVEPPAEVQLLAAIREVFEANDTEFLTSEELVKALRRREEAPWSDPARPLTAHRLARMLREFGIRPQLTWQGSGAVRGYPRAAFEEVWERYLPAPASYGRQTVRNVRTRATTGFPEPSKPLGLTLSESSKTAWELGSNTSNLSPIDAGPPSEEGARRVLAVPLAWAVEGIIDVKGWAL